MELDAATRYQQLEEYKKTLKPLLRYLPWLEQTSGGEVSKSYNGETTVMSFPVYDGTMMSFVREVSRTPFMDRNYRYVYTRNRITSHDDERRVIEKATIKEWDMLCGILSKYVLGGQTRATLWNEAVKERIFYLVLQKMCEIIEFWDKQFAKKA
ncbi:MAG: hypothetical protein IJ716_12695 [Lachnospiraceae bacterium]|nr:hypothetical protein [Lachnospiraceae bacterium]